MCGYGMTVPVLKPKVKNHGPHTSLHCSARDGIIERQHGRTCAIGNRIGGDGVNKIVPLLGCKSRKPPAGIKPGPLTNALSGANGA